jgi:hypothetical protein
VTEVDTGFQHLTHGDRHVMTPKGLSLHPPAAARTF